MDQTTLQQDMTDSQRWLFQPMSHPRHLLAPLLTLVMLAGSASSFGCIPSPTAVQVAASTAPSPSSSPSPSLTPSLEASPALTVDPNTTTIEGEVHAEDGSPAASGEVLIEPTASNAMEPITGKVEGGRYSVPGIKLGVSIKVVIKVDGFELLEFFRVTVTDDGGKVLRIGGVPLRRKIPTRPSPTPSPTSTPSPAPTPTPYLAPSSPPSTSSGSNCHYVSGYRRKDGTYVRGYTRCY